MTEQQNKIYDYTDLRLYWSVIRKSDLLSQCTRKKRIENWPFFQTPGIFSILKQVIFAFIYVLLRIWWNFSFTVKWSDFSDCLGSFCIKDTCHCFQQMLLVARLLATHLQPYSTETSEEEQTSLSTDIKNHYFDSFTNSFVSSAVEDGWQDAVDVLIRSLILIGTCGTSYRTVVRFRQSPITYVSVTLHAAVNTSLPVITRESGVVILLEALYIPVSKH